MRRNLIFAATFTGFCACAPAHAVTMWGVDSNTAGSDRVVRFESSNPAGTIVTVGTTGVSGFLMSGLDFDAAGTLYACSAGATSVTGSLYTINQSTGAATLVGSLALPSGRNMTDMTFNPATAQMHGVAFDGQRNYLYTISTTTGAASLVGEINSPGSILLGLCADAAGRLYVEASGGRMLVLDGLNAVAMPQSIGVNTIFSQGMTMDWSQGGAWYLAATFQHEVGGFNARGDVRLIDRATGGTQRILGTWPQLSNDTYPRYAIGDIAIRPVPEPASVLTLCVLVFVARHPRRASQK